MSKERSRRRRQHFRADGKPKAALLRAEAERRVVAADPRDQLDAYECEVCGAWHIGHPRES